MHWSIVVIGICCGHSRFTKESGDCRTELQTQDKGHVNIGKEASFEYVILRYVLSILICLLKDEKLHQIGQANH